MWAVGVMLLSVALVSCTTATRTAPCGDADESYQPPQTVAAYRAQIRRAMAFCERWGLVDDALRCEEELRRLDQNNALPKEFDPEMLDILQRPPRDEE
jgi:hypothetical protein